MQNCLPSPIAKERQRKGKERQRKIKYLKNKPKMLCSPTPTPTPLPWSSKIQHSMMTLDNLFLVVLVKLSLRSDWMLFNSDPHLSTFIFILSHFISPHNRRARNNILPYFALYNRRAGNKVTIFPALLL